MLWVAGLLEDGVDDGEVEGAALLAPSAPSRRGLRGC